MNVQSFETIKVPILGHLGVPRKKCHFNVAPTKNYRVYYKEGSGASSQRLRAV